MVDVIKGHYRQGLSPRQVSEVMIKEYGNGNKQNHQIKVLVARTPVPQQIQAFAKHNKWLVSLLYMDAALWAISALVLFPTFGIIVFPRLLVAVIIPRVVRGIKRHKFPVHHVVSGYYLVYSAWVLAYLLNGSSNWLRVSVTCLQLSWTLLIGLLAMVIANNLFPYWNRGIRDP